MLVDITKSREVSVCLLVQQAEGRLGIIEGLQEEGWGNKLGGKPEGAGVVEELELYMERVTLDEREV